MREHPQACGLLVLALFFFLIMSCFTPSKKKYIHLHDSFGSCKKVSSPKKKIITVSPKMEDPQIIKKPPYSTENKY
jgi:hypothetical protein